MVGDRKIEGDKIISTISPDEMMSYDYGDILI